MNKHRIAIIAGDGIGKEVIPAGLNVLRAAARGCGFELETEEFPWGCDYYLQTGRMMDADGLTFAGFPGDLPRRYRRSGARARSHQPARPVDQNPPELRPVHQSAPDQTARRNAKPTA